MQAEVRWIEANDIGNWPNWLSAGPADEYQWFTVSVGTPGNPGADFFQVAVATPLGLRERRRNGRFIGLIVEQFKPEVVEQVIKDYVAACEAPSWQGVVDLLCARMSWEYQR